MAGPLLRVLIRLKSNKYHRMQIAARYRIIDLFHQIARDLQISVDLLFDCSIYRGGPTSYSLIYPSSDSFSTAHFDAQTSLDQYGLTSSEEVYIDLREIFHCQTSSNDEPFSINEHSSVNGTENFELSKNSALKLVSNSDESNSNFFQPKTTNNSLSKKPILGQLIRFSVPADNSCLFSSIYFVLHSGKLDLSANKQLRNLVASKIESDQKTYSEAMLGRSNSDYCKWIRKDDSWGGGIELAILTQEYEIEICVINTESGGRIDYFGEDRHFPYRVFLLYNNLHYDPVYLVSYDVTQQKELIQTKFHRNDEAILALVKDLIEQFRSDEPSVPEKAGLSAIKSDSHLIHLKF